MRATLAQFEQADMRALPSIFTLGALLMAVPVRPCAGQPAAPLRIELRDFGKDSGWSAWAQRDEIRPRCFVDTEHFRSAPEALAISGNGNPAEYGGWAYTVDGVRGAQYYRLTAYYRARSVADEGRQIVARIDWLDSQGRRTGQPDYAYETAADGDWTRVTLRVPARRRLHARGSS